jgi:hypothetical protein
MVQFNLEIGLNFDTKMEYGYFPKRKFQAPLYNVEDPNLTLKRPP